jgi:uncharacterized protein (TIGR02284 family)
MINDYEARHDITDENYATANTAATISNDDVISTLNGLIETCKDGQEGFKQAAEGILNSQLKARFYEYSQQRSQFTGELQTLVRELGGDPDNSGSVAGSLHRSWIDIKSIVTGQDEGAILNEAERGEDYAKSAYQKALEQNLPANVYSVINNQYGAIKEAHNQVRAWRDAANNAAKSAKNY